MFTTLVVLFYLLVSGEIFLRRLVEVLPGFGKKRQAVEISLSIEQNISAYLLTVTLINVVVGLAAMVIMWSLRVDDPLLWGVIAFVVNYVPILGPACGDRAVHHGRDRLARSVPGTRCLPAGLYFCVHVMEGEIFTPMLLARRFTINPVAVILALVFWYWMWGVAGAILAVPMLAITKIICDDIRPLRALGHFLEGWRTDRGRAGAHDVSGLRLPKQGQGHHARRGLRHLADALRVRIGRRAASTARSGRSSRAPALQRAEGPLGCAVARLNFPAAAAWLHPKVGRRVARGCRLGDRGVFGSGGAPATHPPLGWSRVAFRNQRCCAAAADQREIQSDRYGSPRVQRREVADIWRSVVGCLR